jgi:hypothetical protein
MISACIRLASSPGASRQVRWAQHVEGMVCSSVIPIRQQLEWSTGGVDTVGAELCMTSMSGESRVKHHIEACRNLIVPTASTRGAIRADTRARWHRGKWPERPYQSSAPSASDGHAQLTAFPSDAASEHDLHHKGHCAYCSSRIAGMHEFSSCCTSTVKKFCLWCPLSQRGHPYVCPSAVYHRQWPPNYSHGGNVRHRTGTQSTIVRLADAESPG